MPNSSKLMPSSSDSNMDGEDNKLSKSPNLIHGKTDKSVKLMKSQLMSVNGHKVNLQEMLYDIKINIK